MENENLVVKPNTKAQQPQGSLPPGCSMLRAEDVLDCFEFQVVRFKSQVLRLRAHCTRPEAQGYFESPKYLAKAVNQFAWKLDRSSLITYSQVLRPSSNILIGKESDINLPKLLLNVAASSSLLAAPEAHAAVGVLESGSRDDILQACKDVRFHWPFGRACNWPV